MVAGAAASFAAVTDPATPEVLRRAPHVAWVAVDDDVVALDPAGRAHVITATGALLWPLLDGRTTVAELAADVADVFGIDPDAAVADVRQFVDDMVGCELLEARASAGGE